MTERYHENTAYHRYRLITQTTHIMVSTSGETGGNEDEQPLAQLFPAPPSPVINVSGLNSAPVGPERRRSHTPASRSICTLRGTYFIADPESTSEKYVSTYTVNSTTRGGERPNQQPRIGKVKTTSRKKSEVGEEKNHGWKLTRESCNGSVPQYVCKRSYRVIHDQLPEITRR